MATPELCVIVLSYRNEETVLAAVDSLLAQDEPLEIVVAHSGGGPTPNLLARARPSVRVVASEHRRMPGWARNAGVAATRAPFVAFLAADCLAAPRWAAGRLDRHRAGAQAVTSSLVPLDPSPPSVASHLFQHSARMPHLSMPERYRHGVSYARSTLERFGPFDERVIKAEDVFLNDRLRAAGIEIVAAPEVVVVHRYPTAARVLVPDQYRRGSYRARRGRGPRWRLRTLAEGPGLAFRAMQRAVRPGSPYPRAELVRISPWLGLAALSWSAGAAHEAVTNLRRARADTGLPSAAGRASHV